jgi:hypothetical protein
MAVVDNANLYWLANLKKSEINSARYHHPMLAVFELSLGKLLTFTQGERQNFFLQIRLKIFKENCN